MIYSSTDRVQITLPIVSLEAFHGILWTAFVICFLAFALRLYIRYYCFRRFLADDWVMMFAFMLLLSVVALGQAFLIDIYELMKTQNGEVLPDTSFPRVMKNGLRGFTAALFISFVGIWAVKINFLLLFKRLGTQITSYLVFWYIVLFITIAFGATHIGFIDWKCIFGSFEYIMMHCAARSTTKIKHSSDTQKVSVILDVISDALIICFPVVILWKVRISLRKKIILSCTFGLVGLTIAVTIVRGSVLGGTYKGFDRNKSRVLDMTWVLFWIFIEFAVAFLIACVVSYRALFAQKEKKAHENQMRAQEVTVREQQISSISKRLQNIGVLRRAIRIHDSILQSIKTLETVNGMPLPEPASGRFSPTFLTDIERTDS